MRVAQSRHQFESGWREQEIDVTGNALYEGVTAQRGGLLECQEPHGFVYFAPPALKVDASCVLRVVFRPLVARAVAQSAALASCNAAGATMESR